MPQAFQKLYDYFGRVAEFKFHTVNRFLATEPYSARLCSRENGRYWYIEFASYEDYIAFLVKWG